MTALFAAPAADHDLLHQNAPAAGLADEYLYSQDMVHKYAFARWWGDPDPATSAVWVLFHPATAETEQRYRPTLERCVTWSRAAGRTGLIVVNLFAYCHTDPRQVPHAADPVGPANDHVLRAVTAVGARAVAAWGRPSQQDGRSAHVAPLLNSPLCLGTTQRGEPKHPGRVRADTPFLPWTPTPAANGRPTAGSR